MLGVVLTGCRLLCLIWILHADSLDQAFPFWQGWMRKRVASSYQNYLLVQRTFRRQNHANTSGNQYEPNCPVPSSSDSRIFSPSTVVPTALRAGKYWGWLAHKSFWRSNETVLKKYCFKWYSMMKSKFQLTKNDSWNRKNNKHYK